MKKINLIERLWTDSHEKQTPQRLKRYAGMLLMLLTIGVGQMWADNYYVRGANPFSWDNGTIMTNSSVSTNVYYLEVYGSREFKIVNEYSGWSCSVNKGSGDIKTAPSNNVSLGNNNGNISGGGNYTWYICYDKNDGKVYGTTADPDDSGSPSYPNVCIAGNSWGGLGNWSANGSSMTNNGDGTYEWTSSSVTAGTSCQFKLCPNCNWDSSIGYSNKVSGTNCTPAPESNDGSNICFSPEGTGTVTITYDSESGNIEITCAAASETTYSVTFYAGANGSISAKGTNIDANENATVQIGSTSRTLTATPASGYHFAGWTKSGSVTIADASSASTTVTATGTGTVTATWIAASGWYLHGDIDGSTTWEAGGVFPYDRPVDNPYRGISGIYYRPITNLENGHWFGIHDGSNKYSGTDNTEGSDYNYNNVDQVVTLYVNSKKSFYANNSSLSNKWVVIKTTDTKKFWIQSSATYYTVSVSNEGSGARGTVTLKEKVYDNLVTNQFKSGETIRVEIDTVAHYSIKSVKLGDTNVTMTHSSGTKFTGDVVMPASDKTLTVTYTPWYQVNFSVSPAAAASAPTNNKSLADGDYIKGGTSITFTREDENTGYTWSRWENGSGSSLGTGNTYTTTISGTTTIVAKYTENTFNVSASASPAAGGSVTPTSATSMGQVAGGNITASNNPGYSFSGWSIASGSGYFGASGTATTSDTANTKFRPTAAATLTGSFSEVMRTVTVAVNNSYLGSVSTTSLSSVGPATKSAEVTATAETGATFTGWSVVSGLTIADGYTTSSNPVKVNATAASKTLTANFTETMHTVTLTNDNSTYGTVNTSSPLSVGQITAVQIQATPKSGYMFSKWVKTSGTGTVTYLTGAGNGQVEDASGEEKETTYITVTGNVTLQATWEPDRSSGYAIHYGNSGKNADGGTDASQTRPWKDGKLYRATTEASDVSYFTFTAGVGDVDKTIYFKIWETSSSTWYGYNSSDGGKITGNVNEATLSTSYGDARLCITMPGNYVFTWNSDDKTLSVAYPNDVYYLRGGWDSWSWSHPMTETSSGVYSATVNMTEANHTYEAGSGNGFKVLIAGKYYGKNSTTVTRSTSTGSAAISSCSTSGANMGLTTDYTGDYTFTYTVSTNTLQVTYPTAYKITFDQGAVDGKDGSISAVNLDNGSSAVTSNSTWVKSGHRVKITAPSAKDYYTYDGWFSNNAGTGDAITTEANCTTTVNTDGITRYACYHENMTTVTLVASPTGKGTFQVGGATVTSTTAGKTTTRSVTAVPGTGYSITGSNYWTVGNANITLSSRSTNPTTVTGCGTDESTSTLTATFTPNVYTITLNDNNGSGGVGSATVTFEVDDYTYASSFVAPTRTGYIFQGYYTASAMADGTQLIDKDGNWVADENETYTDEDGNWIWANNKTLYAGWTPITYTVTYHANGGSAKSEQTDPTVTNWTYDVAQYISVPSSYFDAPTKYALFSDDSKYWNDSEHGDGTDYAWGERSNLTSTDGGNINLYAQWYTQVTLDKNHVDATNNASMRVRYNQHVTYNKAILPSRVGYHRTGFYTASADGTKAFEADGTMVSGDVSGFIDDGYWIYTYDDAEDPYPTFYTYWAENHYSVTFDANDCASYVGEATGSKASVADVAYETYVDITAGTLAREGYTFAGWSKTECATSATYMGDTWRRISYVDGDDVTLYAVWTPKTYTISFNALGGDCYTTSKNVNMGDTYGYLPTAYGKSGYEFVGWYTRPEGGTEVTEETQMVTASDHTLYAHYEKKARVYFKNTLGWDAVYVTWDATWNYNSEDKGAGARGKTQEAMTNFYGTDIWYKDIPAAIISSWKGNIAFTSKAMNNYDWFDEGQAVYRRDFDSDATMFVPTPNDSHAYTKNTHDSKPGTEYYSTDMVVDKSGDDITNYRYKNGYWVRYEELQAGYTVKGSWAWDDDHYVERKDLNDSTYVFTIRNLSANSDYWFNLYKHCTTSNNYSSVFKPNANITSANAEDVVFSAEYAGGGDKKMTTTVAGDYTFKFVFSALGEIRLTIEYPFGVNDYRVVYSYTKDGAKTFSSEYIKAEANAVDTISMFIHSGDSATARSLYIQKCTAIEDGVPTWNATYSEIALPSETASGKTSGVYNFKIAQDESSAATGESVGKYTGNYYIRTDSADGGWDHYKEYPINLMTLSEYSMTQTLSEPYSHYYCQYIGNSTTDISYTIATDYSPAICPVLEGDATIGAGNKKLPSGKPASVRFTWNEETNATFRAYLKSAQGDGNTRYLLIHGADDDMIFNTAGAVIADSVAKSMAANELLFKDTENWVYELAFKAKPGAKVSVIAQYNDVDRYLVGDEDAWETIISGGTSSTKYDIAAVYDFKTNRLITTWIPSGTISETISETDVLIERQYQGGGTTITFGKATEEAKAGSISAKRVIGALKFEYSDLVGRVASWNETSRAMLMYFVSFPFDVNVSDIFGLNTEYGDAFVVQHYNSKLRAEKGFFGGDGTESFWEDMPVDTVMHANVGYVVVMDNDYMNGDVGHVWDNKKPGEHVYLYFPSANDPEHPIILNSEEKTVTLPANECKINRTFNGGKLNHKYTDSNWNVMGVPIFQNHTGDATAGTPGAIFTPTKEPKDTTEFSPEFGYFYKWSTSKDYTVTAAAGFTFLPMHSYLVQYAGDVTFTQAAPAVVAAPRRALKNEENYKIELQVLNSNEDMLNRTYVELREEAVDSFALNEDLFMVSNKRAVNVYTFAGTYDVSANVMSINSHIVPVGVIVKQAGTYTFTMPSDFSGTVTLVDTYTDARTNLALDNYEVNLPKGTNDERFLLEININKVPTAIDGTAGASLKDGKAHKFIMDQQMYILKNGVIYDARGQRVK